MDAKSELVPATELAQRNPIRFPNESAEYRQARNALLAEEIELRRHIERVARQRRKLPPGGEVTKRYTFQGENGPVTLADLFGDKDTLVIYSYMFGPQREKPCPMCTSIMASWDHKVPDIEQRVALAMVARSPIDRLVAAKRARGWQKLKVYADVDGDSPAIREPRGCRHARLYGLHAPGREDPAFLERRVVRHPARSRARSPRCTGPGPVVEPAGYHAGRARYRLVSEAGVLVRHGA